MVVGCSAASFTTRTLLSLSWASRCCARQNTRSPSSHKTSRPASPQTGTREDAFIRGNLPTIGQEEARCLHAEPPEYLPEERHTSRRAVCLHFYLESHPPPPPLSCGG